MKYIYQKRTLHSFPDDFKLKSYMYLQSQTSRLSLSFDEICSWLQLANSRPTYCITVYVLYVPGKNVYSKDGGSWIGILYEKHKNEYLYVVSRNYTVGFNSLLLLPLSNNITYFISYIVCPIYYLVLPLTLVCRRREKATTTTTTTTTKVPSSHLFKPPTLLIDSYLSFLLLLAYPFPSSPILLLPPSRPP